MPTSRKPNRRDGKQISFFTNVELHKSIKKAASNEKSTIKDYLINLHLEKDTGMASDDRLESIYDMLKELTDNQSFVLIPRSQQALVKSLENLQNS